MNKLSVEEAIAESKNVYSLSKVAGFLATATARELEQFHAGLVPEDVYDWNNRARIALEVRLAQDAAESANKLIQHTEKLTDLTNVHIQQTKKMTEQTERLAAESASLTTLTWALLWLTAFLAVFAVVQIIIMLLDYCGHN